MSLTVFAFSFFSPCEQKAIFSNDNAAKLVLQIRFKNDEVNDKDANGGAEESNDDDVFLRKVEESLLNTMELRGIKGISKVFLRQEKVAKFSPAGKFTKEQEEWVLDTEGVALLRVMCVEEVDHTQCNSNGQWLRAEIMRVASRCDPRVPVSSCSFLSCVLGSLIQSSLRCSMCSESRLLVLRC